MLRFIRCVKLKNNIQHHRSLFLQYCTHEKLSKFSYWKSQYQNKLVNSVENKGFDWFLGPDDNITDIIQKHILEMLLLSRGSEEIVNPLKYLELGCGTSLVPHKVLTSAINYLKAHESISNITSRNTPIVTAVLVDYVQEALQFQNNLFDRNLIRSTSDYQVMCVCADVTSLPLRSETFNLVVDKGTLDSLIRDRTKGKIKSELMMSEALRILVKGGRYLQISDEDPDVRIEFLDNLWKDVYKRQPLCLSNDVSNNTSLTRNEGSTLCEDIESHDKDLNFSSSSWSFQIIQSKWDQEYFLYWRDK